MNIGDNDRKLLVERLRSAALLATQLANKLEKKTVDAPEAIDIVEDVTADVKYVGDYLDNFVE